jgi:hypothetical protein
MQHMGEMRNAYRTVVGATEGIICDMSALTKEY